MPGLCPVNPAHGLLYDIPQSENLHCPHSDHYTVKTESGIIQRPGVFTNQEAYRR